MIHLLHFYFNKKVYYKKKKYKTGEFFILNYLQSKHKHSKSITKGMSKSKLLKEQTRWRLGTAFNNNKKYEWFLFEPLMKIERHILLVHLHLLSTDSQYYLPSFFFSPNRTLKNSFLFLLACSKNHSSCASPTWPVGIIPHVSAWLVGKIILHLPAPLEKSLLICWPNPASWPSIGLRPDLGPCRPLTVVKNEWNSFYV